MTPFIVEQYCPKETFQVNKQPHYLCAVRQKHIQQKPEEKVRQAFINFLVTERGFPLCSIKVEVPLSRYVPGTPGRADLIINNDAGEPFILIECKDGSSMVTDEVYEQIASYSEVVSVEYLMVVNGNEVFVYAFNEQGDVYELNTLQTYDELLYGHNLSIEEVEVERYKRPPFQPPFPSGMIKEKVEYGQLGADTPEAFLPLIFNLDGWLYDEDDKLKASGFKSLQEVTDMGVRTTKIGNASGGSWPGEYRYFNVAHIGNNTLLSIGLFGGAIPILANGEKGKGRTFLNIAVNNHNSLQLSLDRYTHLDGNSATLWHDGTITVGKKGRAKREDLINYVKRRTSNLIHEGEVFLGTINFGEPLTATSPGLQALVENLLTYALIRDEFRNLIKGK